MTRQRLDQLLVDRGLFPSRARAAAAILAGDVLLGPDRRRAAKAGQPVASDALVDVVAQMPYVSRGGIKLANALDAFKVPVRGRRALDVGASTGGFTDCLLQCGACHVVAVDVAYGELSWKLREDPRVTVIERCNARALDAARLPYAPELIVMDLSFISLTKVLPAVLATAAPDYDCLAMVKPQFEVGRERVGKGGVVRDPEARREALLGVAEAAVALGARLAGCASSGLPGPKGNREAFLWLRGEGDGHDPAAILEAVAL
ncbi:TlyA family RNA methyltransferase [Conexibacter sp. DBS9H8]|uniref:TlyA family RNA methyltransferase n=1 Tax=Conexibacter sp. DBS9H8 TaxID=2937801 RepID=UPI00200EA784|nr:TlyA family RNA methyltransferase [Conexibacter sp. DBS9H8]